MAVGCGMQGARCMGAARDGSGRAEEPCGAPLLQPACSAMPPRLPELPTPVWPRCRLPPAGSESEDEDEEEGSEESSEDEEAPDAVPLKGTAPKPVKPRARSLIDDEAEESSEEEEDMEGGCRGLEGWGARECMPGQGDGRAGQQHVGALCSCGCGGAMPAAAAAHPGTCPPLPPPCRAAALLLTCVSPLPRSDDSEEDGPLGRRVRIVGDDEESSEEGELAWYGDVRVRW